MEVGNKNLFILKCTLSIPNTDVLYILMYLDIQQVVKAERRYYLCFIEWGKI